MALLVVDCCYVVSNTTTTTTWCGGGHLVQPPAFSLWLSFSCTDVDQEDVFTVFLWEYNFSGC